MVTETEVPPAVLPNRAGEIIEKALRHDRRVLLFGPPGIGKSTLAAALADGLLATGRDCYAISADPGSPAFGLPGAITLGRRRADGWQALAHEPLCSLDAGRFRLPLIGAVRRLVARFTAGALLIDSPGVVRGVAGSELLQGLVEAAAVDLVLVLSAPGRDPPLADGLAALAVERLRIQASELTGRPGQSARARARSARWDAYLESARRVELDLSGRAIVGTPPPVDEPEAWVGRQIALSRAGRCIAMGEVAGLDGDRLVLRTPDEPAGADALLVRDASRGADGLLASAASFAGAAMGFVAPGDLLAPPAAGRPGPRPAGRIGTLDVALVNGLFGDPLLHARLRHCARSLLFDLGDGSRLPARVAHRVTDVFISHAHMDHLSGFVWLLRSRIGDLPPCRLYGPPWLTRHIRGLIEGFLWDRAGTRGPAFEVFELHGPSLYRFALQAGYASDEKYDVLPVTDDAIRVEPGFRIRAVTLDHHTPVLGYAFEPDRELRVRKDRLRRLGLEPGPWLNELKRHVNAGETAVRLSLPGGDSASVAELAGELVLISPGKRLVYATDLADSADNRERLVDLARHAHTLFLEAPFAEADRKRAETHGHLTARACGEIATAAGVARLVPFHFSRRYANDPQPLVDELRAACGCVVLPDPRALRAGARGVNVRYHDGTDDYSVGE